MDGSFLRFADDDDAHDHALEGAPVLPDHAHVTTLTLHRLSRRAAREIVRAIPREQA